MHEVHIQVPGLTHPIKPAGFVQINPATGEPIAPSGMQIPHHDKVEMVYTGSNLTGVVYKLAGTTVATLTLAYTGSNLTSVTKG